VFYVAPGYFILCLPCALLPIALVVMAGLTSFGFAELIAIAVTVCAVAAPAYPALRNNRGGAAPPAGVAPRARHCDDHSGQWDSSSGGHDSASPSGAATDDRAVRRADISVPWAGSPDDHGYTAVLIQQAALRRLAEQFL